MRRTGLLAGPLLGLLASLLALACASRGIELREYVLTSVTRTDAGASKARKLEIRVGPVTLPPYLRRAKLVTRVGPNELRVSDTQRWGEDLDRGLARVLAENIAVQVPATQVHAFPWQQLGGADYRVSIEVERFEQIPDGSVALEARWSLLRERETVPVDQGRVSLREDRDGPDAAATVGAMSRSAARLSEPIAAAIRIQADRAANR